MLVWNKLTSGLLLLVFCFLAGESAFEGCEWSRLKPSDELGNRCLSLAADDSMATMEACLRGCHWLHISASCGCKLHCQGFRQATADDEPFSFSSTPFKHISELPLITLSILWQWLDSPVPLKGMVSEVVMSQGNDGYTWSVSVAIIRLTEGSTITAAFTSWKIHQKLRNLFKRKRIEAIQKGDDMWKIKTD